MFTDFVANIHWIEISSTDYGLMLVVSFPELRIYSKLKTKNAVGLPFLLPEVSDILLLYIKTLYSLLFSSLIVFPNPLTAFVSLAAVVAMRASLVKGLLHHKL